MQVIFANKFSNHVKNFPKSDRKIIYDFTRYVETYGFDGLKGRNKPSDDVPTNDPNWLTKVKYAQKYKLWHFHIGIPSYELSAKGDYTSEYLLHYMFEDNFIVLVDMSPHPPFFLPDESYLIY